MLTILLIMVVLAGLGYLLYRYWDKLAGSPAGTIAPPPPTPTIKSTPPTASP